MLFFIRSVVAQTLLNGYLLFRIYRSKEVPRALKHVFAFIYGTETLMYFTGLIFSERLPIEVFRTIQVVSGIWVIAHLYVAALVSIFDGIHYLNKRVHIFSSYVKEKTLRTAKILTFILFFTFICSQLYVGYDNFLHPEIKTFTFPFNKGNAEGASPRKTYKMLVATDIHLGYIINRRVLEKYVRIINEQQADIVVIGGDLIDYTMHPLIEERMDEELRKIKAPKGVFFIPGNHEYKFNSQERFDWIAGAGMIVLKDSIADVGGELQLIGRDDRKNKKLRMPIDELMSGVDTSKARVFLAHQPGDIPDGYSYKIPLTVCGHTHCGQVWPGNIVAALIYPNGFGMQKRKNCYSYTSSGLGLSGFPLRISCPSEVVIFNIEIY